MKLLLSVFLEKFPLHDATFMHAKFVDFTRKEAAEFRM